MPRPTLVQLFFTAGAASTVKLAVLAGNHDLMVAAQAPTASLERAGKLVADFIVTQ